MSDRHIPGLNTLFAPKGSNNDPSTSVTDDQAVTQEPQPTAFNNANSQPTDSKVAGDEMVLDKHADSKDIDDEMAVDHPPSPPSLTSGLEALLGGLDPLPETTPILPDPSINTTSAPLETNGSTLSGSGHEEQVGEAIESGNGGMEEEHPEWEADSSPYESSSDSSSSDDSDDDSDDEKDYKVLGPEETARILMEMDGGSDDEGDGKGKGSGSLVRTKNELPESIIPRPDVEIKPEMEIIELGTIEHFVDNIAVIKANTTGEYEVLDTGSVLCLQDRTVIAALADVIAAVREPRYTAGFTDEEEIKSFGLEVGTKIFYPPAHANLGMTQALRVMKGTDASNWHDEEVAEDEVEFSDDEKEAEHKRQLKAKKRGARGGRDGGVSRGGRNDSVTGNASTPSNGLNYDDDDDDDDDGPYRPLPRPMGFGQSQPALGGNETASGFSGHGGAYRGNRGDFRGRGSRGRAGRGNRGGNTRNGHSLPPRPQGQAGQGGAQGYQQTPTRQYSLPPAPPMPIGGQPYPVFPPPQPNGQQPPQPSNQQFPFAWPQNPQPGFYPPPPPQFTGQPGANGMYFNPNLLAVLQAQVQNQSRQDQQNQQTQQNPHQSSQWPGQQGQSNNQWAGQGGHG